MEQRVFSVNRERFLEEYSGGLSAGQESAAKRPLWVDIHGRDPAALAKVLAGQDLHPLAIEACLEVTPKSRIVAYGQALFIGLPVQIRWDASERSYLSIACLPGMIITLHESLIPAIENIIKQYLGSIRFHRQNTSAILYQILDDIIDRDMVFTMEAREAIDSLEELYDQGSESILSQKIHPLKQQISHLEAMFEDQLHCVRALQTIDSDAFEIEGLQDYLRDAVSHLEHSVRSLDRQAARLTEIHQYCLLQLQGKANKRLQVLTVISAIFLPLMLITGIYGMNFRYMPELTWEYGYFGVLGLMIAIGLILLRIFFSKGWFK